MTLNSRIFIVLGFVHWIAANLNGLQQAADLLFELYDYYGSIHNTRYLIDVLILQALVYDSQGDEPVALEYIINNF